MNFQASKLGVRLEMAGFSRLFRDLWILARFVTKVCLWLSLPLGLLGVYYFNYFHIRHFEDPTAGLSYVSDTNAAQRNEFRKRTTLEVVEPIRQQLARIKLIRRQTKGGTVRPPTLEQDASEIRNRLKEIKTEARRRRIPKEFKRQYEPSIFAIQDAFRSINDLEDSFEQETEFSRKELYNDSIKKWRAAEKKNNTTRDYFSLYEWPRPPERKEPHWRPVRSR